MKISLVVSTISRKDELLKLLNSLKDQTYKDFEVIIVDQNKNGLLNQEVSKYNESMKICHIFSEPGLSCSRNIGLRHIKGDIIAFPDDDCWYYPDTLKKIIDLFSKNSEYDGVTGICIDENGSYIEKKKYNEKIRITKKNVWHTGKSVTIFIRRKVIDAVGGFDENIGAGSKTGIGSGEETDYLIRAIEKNFALYHYPYLTIGHPRIIQSYSNYKKAYSYTVGLGFISKKYKFYSYFISQVLRSVAGIFLGIMLFNIPKIRYHYFVVKGKVSGFFFV